MENDSKFLNKSLYTLLLKKKLVKIKKQFVMYILLDKVFNGFEAKFYFTP